MSNERNMDCDKAAEFQENTPLSTVYRSFSRLVLLISSVCISSFYFGYIIIYMNLFPFSSIEAIFPTSIAEGTANGLLTFCVPLGGTIGSLLTSFFLRHYGRIQSIEIVSIIAILLSLGTLIPSFEIFIVIRIGQGLCAGIFSAIVPLAIKQISPTALSGIFGVFQQIFITLGLFYACAFYYTVSLFTQDPSGLDFWKVIFLFPIFILALQFILLRFVFQIETPSYLVSRSRHEEARMVVSRIYNEEYVDRIMEDLDKSFANKEVEGIQEKTALKYPNRIALHLSLLQQFVGISATMSFSGQIIEGGSKNLKAMLPSLMALEQVIAAFVSITIVKFVGRKRILQFGTMMSLLTNLMIGFGCAMNQSLLSQTLVIMGVLLFILIFGMTLGPVVWMYIPEIVQPDFLPYSTMANWGASAFVSFIFPVVTQALPNRNPALIFFSFALWSFISFFVNKYFLIETKGKTAVQIKEEFENLEEKEVII